jgi:hypothetical protein
MGILPGTHRQLLPLLRPLNTPEQLALLQEVAAQDNHTVVGATHLVWKDGQIAGYGSLGGIPVLNVWLDSRKVHARESLVLLNAAEAILANAGVRGVLMPCAENSPFKPYMQKLGYAELGETVMHIKQI